MILGIRYSHDRHRGSVLPTIALERSKGAVRVVAGPPTWKEGATIACLILMLIGLVLIIIFVAHPSRRLEGIFSTVAIATAVATMLGQWMRKRMLRRATLQVEPWPLRVGETATLQFEKRLTRNAFVSSFVAQFECQEEATISTGKYQEIRKATRHQTSLDTTKASIAENVISDRWEVVIPQGALPSFSVKSNRLRWLVTATTSVRGVEVPAEFELLVIPERKR